MYAVETLNGTLVKIVSKVRKEFHTENILSEVNYPEANNGLQIILFSPYFHISKFFEFLNSLAITANDLKIMLNQENKYKHDFLMLVMHINSFSDWDRFCLCEFAFIMGAHSEEFNKQFPKIRSILEKYASKPTSDIGSFFQQYCQQRRLNSDGPEMANV